MRLPRSLIGVVTVVTLSMAFATPLAAGASGSTVHDGIYSMNGFDAGYSYATLKVVGNGTKIAADTGRNSAVACTNSPSLASQDPSLTSISVVVVELPTMSISRAGTASYSGNATVNARTTPDQTFSVPITFKVTFVKGNIVAKKTVAAIVTFSSSAACETATPTRFLLKWYS